MQTRKHSVYEALANSIIGFAIATGIQVFAFSLYQISLPTYEAALVVLLFTTTSTLRSYLLRRVFNAYEHRRT